MKTAARTPAFLVAAILVGALSSAQTAPYDALTNHLQDFTNLHPEPMHGIAVDAERGIWAVNPYASVIVHFKLPGLERDIIKPTGLAPVSIAVWEPTSDPNDRKILVVCSGTHALFVHNAQTGLIEGVLKLDSEPADIVIDNDTERAFISCAGANTVWKVDIAGLVEEAIYEIPVGQRPGPLFLDKGGPGAADNRVYIASMITGNNSTFLSIPSFDDVGFVFDLDVATVQLPDEDVFRIDPNTDQVEAVVRGAGSLLFGLSRNPATGDLWVLSQDSNNKDLALNSEPLLSGKIAINQGVIVPGVVTGSGLIQAGAGVDLDAVAPGPVYDRTRSINQPDAILHFVRNQAFQGQALISSPFSDVIIRVDAAGARIDEYQLPAGSQCHSIAFYPGENFFLALCLGTMRVEAFNLNNPSAPAALDLSIGPDPTPDQVKRGRDVFLNGQLSSDGRFSCATCHPGGMSDMLGWSIAGLPTDKKDVMVTQTLQSIEDTFPHHWRGERDIFDFIKAYAGVLGAPPAFLPTEEQFADMAVFIQTMKVDANPHQNVARVLDDAQVELPSKSGLNGSAVNGQQEFLNAVNFNQFTCNGCHPMDAGGTTGDYFAEVGALSARPANLETTQLRSLFQKGFSADDTAMIQFGPSTNLIERNENGWGATHSGVFPTVFDFIFDSFGGFPELADDQKRTDIAEFVRQWDNALAPAAHHVLRADSTSTAAELDEVKSLFVDASEADWLDVVFDSLYDDGSGTTSTLTIAPPEDRDRHVAGMTAGAFQTIGHEPVRWWYDKENDVFEADARVASLTWAALRAEIEAGNASGWFIGVPPGSGRAYGIDLDLDGLKRSLEARFGTDEWDPDTDGDGWPDGYEKANGDNPLVAQVPSADTTLPTVLSCELEGSSGRQATYRIRMSEPCTYRVTYSTPGGPVRVFEREFASTNDTFVLTHSEGSTVTLPSIQFGGTVELFDLKGNRSADPQFALAPFTPTETGLQPGVPLLGTHVTEILELSQAPGSMAGSVEVGVRVTTRFSVGAPMNLIPENHIIWAIVAVDDGSGFVQSNIDPLLHETAFKTRFIEGQTGNEIIADFVGTASPFIVAHTPTSGGNGDATFTFEVPDVNPGDVLRFSVQGIALKVLPNNPDPATHVTFVTVFSQQPLLTEDFAELDIVVQ